jgi:Predicted O-methyltransferase
MGDESEASVRTTRDAFFGGRLVLEQPVRGHRSGTDAVLLAAAVPLTFAGRAIDVGAGVGAVGLGIASGSPAASVTLVDIDPDSVVLAKRNIAANGLEGRADAVLCDVLSSADLRARLGAPVDLVVTNPPFYRPEQNRASPDAGRRAAHVFSPGADLGGWLTACMSLLAPKAVFVAILPAAEVPDTLSLLMPRLGDLTLLAVHPRAGDPAIRVLVRGRLGMRGPFRIAPPLMLHDDHGFSDATSRLATGEDRLNW